MRFTTTETVITVGTVLGYFVAKLISQYHSDTEIFIFNAACLGLAALYCAIRINNITIIVSHNFILTLYYPLHSTGCSIMKVPNVRLCYTKQNAFFMGSL